jgi:hypothetical protein
MDMASSVSPLAAVAGAEQAHRGQHPDRLPDGRRADVVTAGQLSFGGQPRAVGQRATQDLAAQVRHDLVGDPATVQPC